MDQNKCYQADILVIGTGIAGLAIALEAAEKQTVILVTKSTISETNTRYAQGGIAAVVSPDDSVESHIEDTLRTGYGLCNEEAVKLLVEQGFESIRRLINWGVDFTTSQSSIAFEQLDLGREGGHSMHRIIHAFDQTGLAMQEALAQRVQNNPNITILENHTLVELITEHQHTLPEESTHCYGAYLFNRKESIVLPAFACNTILATGGIGHIYQYTTNPDIATGDGIAAAWRAGAKISNMEFIQFHPTSLCHPDAGSFLISEALRGHGAILKNSLGEEFMDNYHPMKSLAPRDVVARAIDREIKESGEPCVYLDIRHNDPENTRTHFPKIYAECLKFGIDITTDLIPVVPASHYSCGGIKVDLAGRSSISGLFACGEVSCTGVHGANRLASNSLLEAVVFAHEIVTSIRADQSSCRRISADKIRPWDDTDTRFAQEWVLISHNHDEIRKIMWDYVGIVRTNERLNRAKKRLALIIDEIEEFYRKTTICTSILELRNMATTAMLIVNSALLRKESRGLHNTKDYPETNPDFAQETILKRVTI